MQRKVKLALAGVGLIPVTVVGLFLQFYLPSTRKVQIVGTEVKRLDINRVEDISTRDVRFIIARDAESGEPIMYRNEDTRWGWPPYFKFDSADLGGYAMNVKENHKNAVVRVKYYGWRIAYFDMYPNATSMEIVDPESTHIPFFNIFFFLTLFGLGGFGWYRVRKLLRGWRERRERKLAAKGGGVPVAPAGPVDATQPPVTADFEP